MNLYTAIYYVNKIFPRLAKRLADYFFPIAPWETEHDLDDITWADYNEDYPADVLIALDDALCPCHCKDLELDVPPKDAYPWDALGQTEEAILNLEDRWPDCFACTIPEQYDDHIHPDEDDALQ